MMMIKAEIEPSSNGAKPPRGHVHEHVLRYMRRGLMVGAFLPGQVMSLRKLAAGFGTSPMPVREVLSRLVAANALEETKGGSVRVPRLSPDKLSDLFAVREVLEGMATELAAKKAQPGLIEELTAINKELLTAIEERHILNCLSFNQQFHFTLYEAAASEVLMPLIESLWLQFGPTMYMSLLIPSMPWNASDHGEILAALKENNAAAAKKGIVHDIRTTCKALLSVAGPQGLELPFTHGPELQFDY
ncbi:GntR family transcriptional regulator [Pseudaminobacter sp. NGMCC 1.201702]|uniref:GntR family transcriptional regulator n=1 Tax=Pseudaminobacter sp. NGMCC 1.201702 TaxID=3391825 RepID=UPI0039F0D195